MMTITEFNDVLGKSYYETIFLANKHELASYLQSQNLKPMTGPTGLINYLQSRAREQEEIRREDEFYGQLNEVLGEI